MRLNVGRVNYLVTSRTVRAGQEVTDIYSMHFSEIPRTRRRDWLEQSFHFWCQCEACFNDWDTFDVLGERNIFSVEVKLVLCGELNLIVTPLTLSGSTGLIRKEII